MKADDSLRRDPFSDEKSLLFRGMVSVVCMYTHIHLKFQKGSRTSGHFILVFLNLLG